MPVFQRIFLLFLCAFAHFLTGCASEPENSFDVDLVETSNNTIAFITQETAMHIAADGFDLTIYTPTSAILGPMVWHDREIYAYEVTVNGIDHLFLTYINAESGEHLYDVRHDMPATTQPVDTAEPLPPAYYTSCPSGWPLCIYDPDSIYFYSQNDPGWMSSRINGGGSTETFRSAGCVITVHAMVYRYEGFSTKNPKELDQLADDYNCYYSTSGGSPSESGSYLSSSCIASAVGARTASIGVDQVWNKLAAGYPVIAYGYSTCLGSYHEQMLWGHDGSRYWTKDPWYDWTAQDQSMCLNAPTYRYVY